jgi:hypothetical protein
MQTQLIPGTVMAADSPRPITAGSGTNESGLMNSATRPFI